MKKQTVKSYMLRLTEKRLTEIRSQKRHLISRQKYDGAAKLREIERWLLLELSKYASSNYLKKNWGVKNRTSFFMKIKGKLRYRRYVKMMKYVKGIIQNSDPTLDYTLSSYITNHKNIKEPLIEACKTNFQSNNPIYIVSSKGLEATHSLEACYHYLRVLYPAKKIFYISGYSLHLSIDCAKRKRWINLIEYYLDTVEVLQDYLESFDYLMIDNLEFLQDKPSYLKVVYSLIYHFHGSGKGVIITMSDEAANWKGNTFLDFENELTILTNAHNGNTRE